MENAPSNNEASSGTSALDAGLGIWLRPRPPMFHLCTLDIYQTDKPLNKGVWEIIGYEDMAKPMMDAVTLTVCEACCTAPTCVAALAER